MGPTTNLAYLIQHLSAVLGKQSGELLQQQLGLGQSQFKILMVLEWNPRVQQKAIAESLGQTEASVSRQIKILQERGLLVAKPDPQNRRKHITLPTPLGMQITEAATASLRRNFGPEYMKLGEDQLLQLISGLQQLHKIVCRPGKTGACDHQFGF